MKLLKKLLNVLIAPRDLSGDLRRYIELEYPKEPAYVKAALLEELLDKSSRGRPVVVQRVFLADNESMLVTMDAIDEPCQSC